MSVVVCVVPAVSSVLLSSPPSLFLLCWARSSLQLDKFYGRPRSDKWRDIVNYGIMERKIILHSRTTPTNWYIYDLQESWELSCYLLVCWLISWTCISWHFKRPWTQHIIYDIYLTHYRDFQAFVSVRPCQWRTLLILTQFCYPSSGFYIYVYIEDTDTYVSTPDTKTMYYDQCCQLPPGSALHDTPSL